MCHCWLIVGQGATDGVRHNFGRAVQVYYGWAADDPLPIPCPHNGEHHHHFICKLSIKRCDDTYERKGRKYGRFYSAAAAAGVWARCARANVAVKDKLAAASELFAATDVGGGRGSLQLWKTPADTAAWAAMAQELCPMLCKLNIEYHNLTVHANTAELAPSPYHYLRELVLNRNSHRRVKAVFLAHFPVPENGGVPASPLASSARSMVFLKNTMGVDTSNAVCVDLWPHILDANKGGPSANAELNATAEAQDALDSYARCVVEVAARLAALWDCELVTLGKLPSVYARTTLAASSSSSEELLPGTSFVTTKGVVVWNLYHPHFVVAYAQQAPPGIMRDKLVLWVAVAARIRALVCDGKTDADAERRLDYVIKRISTEYWKGNGNGKKKATASGDPKPRVINRLVIAATRLLQDAPTTTQKKKKLKATTAKKPDASAPAALQRTTTSTSTKKQKQVDEEEEEEEDEDAAGVDDDDILAEDDVDDEEEEEEEEDAAADDDDDEENEEDDEVAATAAAAAGSDDDMEHDEEKQVEEEEDAAAAAAGAAADEAPPPITPPQKQTVVVDDEEKEDAAGDDMGDEENEEKQVEEEEEDVDDEEHEEEEEDEDAAAAGAGDDMMVDEEKQVEEEEDAAAAAAGAAADEAPPPITPPQKQTVVVDEEEEEEEDAAGDDMGDDDDDVVPATSADDDELVNDDDDDDEPEEEGDEDPAAVAAERRQIKRIVKLVGGWRMYALPGLEDEEDDDDEDELEEDEVAATAAAAAAAAAGDDMMVDEEKQVEEEEDAAAAAAGAAADEGAGPSSRAGWRAPGSRFRPFEAARAYAHTLRLTSKDQWQARCKSGKRPDDIPSHPARTYKESGWISWGDFLGFQIGKGARGEFRSFEAARAYAHTLRLTSYDDWLARCKSGKRPYDIPSHPDRTYKESGWTSWGDFLGYAVGKVTGEFRSFEAARAYARTLGLTSVEAWKQWSKTGKRPYDIPGNPSEAYKSSGWTSWPDFLGYAGRKSNTSASKKRKRDTDE